MCVGFYARASPLVRVGWRSSYVRSFPVCRVCMPVAAWPHDVRCVQAAAAAGKQPEAEPEAGTSGTVVCRTRITVDGGPTHVVGDRRKTR